MSRYVAALVYRKKVGSMARKSILAYCAERANDDGSGIWASKVRIAKEVECSKQTVLDTIKAFLAEGILTDRGRRKSPHGYTVEYAVNVGAVLALEDAFEDQFQVDDARGPKLDGSNELTPRGQATGPQEVKPLDPNRPLTVLKEEPPLPPRGNDLFSANSLPESQGTSVDDLFERFWKVFPKKSGKPEAKKAFAKAIKRAPAEIIIQRAERYAAWLAEAGPGEFRPNVKYPQGWLTNDRWNDEELRTPASEPVNRYQKIVKEWGRG